MDIYAKVKYNEPEVLFDVVNQALPKKSFERISGMSLV